jgi:DHA1 family bicyclomycin/chloramphenicol resistance-like MFS transporter
MAAQFHTPASAIQLTLTTFMVGPAAGQLVIGPLSDPSVGVRSCWPVRLSA